MKKAFQVQNKNQSDTNCLNMRVSAQ